MQAETKERATKEEDIPTLVEDAFRKAYARALASGSGVLEVVNGQLVRTNPNGSRDVLKTAKPGRVVTRGAKISLKK